jgi:hypothetical protein
MLVPANTEVNDYLRDQIEFAYEIKKQNNLFECLNRMDHEWYQYPYACILYKDFAKHSFEFSCYRLKDLIITANEDNEIQFEFAPNSRPFTNGGLIYHGPDLDGIKEETFSVELNPSDGWSIHT